MPRNASLYMCYNINPTQSKKMIKSDYYLESTNNSFLVKKSTAQFTLHLGIKTKIELDALS